jgi:hypothetical protein
VDGFFRNVRNISVNCNVRILYRPGYSKTVSRELSKCKLDVVGIEEIRRDKAGAEAGDCCKFLCPNRSASCRLVTEFFIH